MEERIEQDLAASLNAALDKAIFLVDTDTTITKTEKLTKCSAKELRNLFLSGEAYHNLVIRRATIPNDLLDDLVCKLRLLLRVYIEPESDQIGIGIVNLMAGLPGPMIFPPEDNGGETMKEFARRLVKASGTLRPDRVMQILFRWIEDKPLHYTTNVFLHGPSLDRTIESKEGVKAKRLPESPHKLDSHLPRFIIEAYGISLLPGGTILSIPCEATPALYKPSPEREESSYDLQHTCAGGELPDLSVNSFCEALALACDNCVRWGFIWREFGELREFDSRFVLMSPVNTPRGNNDFVMCQDHLEAAVDIHKRCASQVPAPAMAISRWVKSKRPDATFSDKCIDLRIALEALFLLHDPRGEKSFRLAITGARYLGRNLTERQEYRKQLSEIYDLASKAIHAVEIECSEKNKSALTAGQNLCRRGILKRLEQDERQNWNAFLLEDNSE